ncbi:hypothetical protein ACFYOV_31380 [Streptomyces sp. NPDC005931]|uniref:hypothetical protein n=1 Tax=Streptomyces sp. NPDC005931 TaxID=3364737 RepID=UPI0036C00919
MAPEPGHPRTTPATTDDFNLNEDGWSRGVYVTQIPWRLAPSPRRADSIRISSARTMAAGGAHARIR